MIGACYSIITYPFVLGHNEADTTLSTDLSFNGRIATRFQNSVGVRGLEHGRIEGCVAVILPCGRYGGPLSGRRE